MTESANALYEERTQRIARAVALEPSERPPFLPFMQFFPKRYLGATHEQMMYDYELLAKAHHTAILDLQPDAYNHPFPITALGSLMDILAPVIFQWPGGALAADRPYQYVEGEYMTADEYDDFIFDPTDFMWRIFLPRAYKTLEPLKNISYTPGSFYTRFMSALSVFTRSDISRAFQALGRAAAEAGALVDRGARFAAEMKSLGFPMQFGGISYAPFDYIGDLLRGTRGIFLDMFRCPDKLREALQKALKIMVKGAEAACRATGNPYVFIPLHKGNDRHMSQNQFNTFYWPTLKQLILDLIDLDLVPSPFWESECTSRLETIADVPPGKVIYMFEGTDIFRAKEVLGDVVCLRGNVPASLLCVGTPDEVKDYCRTLIRKVGKNGGFILDGGVGIPDEAKLENARAMAEAVREFETS
jgi:Uroporphyrinogen decarboxylase (URO-D)